MRNRILSLLLSTVLLLVSLSAVSLTVNAADASDLSFTLSADGESYYVSACNEDAEGEIIIPAEHEGKPVTAIGENGFYDCRKLTSVIIPDGVTSIGKYAFRTCMEAVTISVPDSVRSIGEFAFSECVKLTSINIPAGVTRIETYTFAICTALSAVALPDTVSYIGPYAFFGCQSVTAIDIPSGITVLNDGVFYDCIRLNTVTIPDSVTHIGTVAFWHCKNLENIPFPDSIENIGSSAFDKTAWYLNQPDGIVYAGKAAYCFKGDASSVESVVIRDGTLSICGYAFNGFPVLSSVTLPSGLKKIFNYAFSDCPSLMSVHIPESVIYIGSRSLGFTDSPHSPVEGFTIHGATGSFAAEYARINRFNFIPNPALCITSDELNRTDGVLYCIHCGDTLAQTLGKINPTDNIKVFGIDGVTELTDGTAFLSTGMHIRLYNEDGVIDEVTLSVLGDVDGDGVITTADARKTLRVAANLDVFVSAQELAARVTSIDGDISTSDARQILRVAAHLESL